MILCLDVGNTHLHWGVLRDGVVVETGSLPSSAMEQGLTEIARKWSGRLHGASWCSVVPVVNESLQKCLSAFLPSTLILGLNYQQDLGIPIHYPYPEQIGQDRLANSIAAARLYGLPAVVIDVGTATTCDVITENGGYEGGLIAPGIGLMTRYLHERTALLPLLGEADLMNPPTPIGKNTREAMSSGCITGFTGMVAALLESAFRGIRELGESKKPHVVLTGGSAGFLSRQFPQYTWDPYLTLQGLALYFIHNHPA